MQQSYMVFRLHQPKTAALPPQEKATPKQTWGCSQSWAQEAVANYHIVLLILFIEDIVYDYPLTTGIMMIHGYTKPPLLFLPKGHYWKLHSLIRNPSATQKYPWSPMPHMLCAENTVELQEPHPWIIDRLCCILGPEGVNGQSGRQVLPNRKVLAWTKPHASIDIENAMGLIPVWICVNLVPPKIRSNYFMGPSCDT